MDGLHTYASTLTRGWKRREDPTYDLGVNGRQEGGERVCRKSVHIIN